MSRPRYVWECTCGEKSEVTHNGVQAQKAAARHERSKAFDVRDHTAEVRRIVATTCDEAPGLTSLDEVAAAVLGVPVAGVVVGVDFNMCPRSAATTTIGRQVMASEWIEADPDACDDCGEPGKGTLRNGICSACRWEARHLQAGLRGGQ